MSGMPSSLAVRPNGYAPAQQHTSEVAIRGGQVNWDDKQRAALVAIGVSEKATKAELAVFFHQCQRLGLDPFSKQIYLIHRKTKDGDRWVEKPTTQIGIDGFRVTRDRIAKRDGLRVEYEDTLWFTADGQACDVWLWDEPPAACKFVVLVDGRRFPAVLRFNEYCQTTRDGVRTGRWRDGFSHQIEKCAEADALRRAFPNDLSGVILEDAAPLEDPDAPARVPADRPRVTAEQARARSTVTATVVTPDASPAGTDAPQSEPPADPPAAAPAGEAPDPDWQRALKSAQAQSKRVLGDDRPRRLAVAARILRLDAGTVQSFSHLTLAELRAIVDTLSSVDDLAQLEALLSSGQVPGGR